MKTVTVSIDDETYRRSCAKAAEAGTDVAEFLRAHLCELVETEEERFDRLLRNTQEFWAKLDTQERSHEPVVKLTREEIHDRAARRRETEEAALREKRQDGSDALR